MLFYIAQAIGIIGLLLAVISFQNKTTKGILFFQILAAITFTLHFFLLGAYTGAVMNILGASRNYVFFNREKNWANKRLWLYFFMVIYIIAGILTYTNYYSLLPTFGMVISSIGLWNKNAKITRILMLPASPSWLIYNVVSNSYAGILTEIFGLSSLIIAIIRFDILKKPKQKQGRT